MKGLTPNKMPLAMPRLGVAVTTGATCDADRNGNDRVTVRTARIAILFI
jgi:hypothetical protein